MGGFYGSIQVRTNDRDAVLRAVEALATGSQRRFFCGPVIKGWIGVYPDHAGQSAADGDAIAARVASDAFYLCVHDDDVFCYRFYQAGRLVDEYVSMPGYFGEARREEELRLVGHPERYASLLDGRVDAVRNLLRRHEDREQPTFESERLAAFAKLLGIANVVTSYESLTEGEREGIRGWRQFVHTPALDDEKRAARTRAAALRSEKAKLVKQGVLLADRTHALFEMIRSDRSLDHVFIEVGGRELHVWGPNWKEPSRAYCRPPKDRIFSAMSSDGQYAVTQRQGPHPFMPGTPIRIANTPELWTLPDCNLIADGESGDPIFAADGSRVLFVPREGGEIVACALPSGELLGRWPSPFSPTVGHGRFLHPVENVVVAADQRRIIVHDLERGATKHISVGESGANKNPYRWIELAKQLQHLGIAALSKLLEDVPERRRADAEKELRRLWPEESVSEHAMSIVEHAMRFSRGLESIVHLRLSCDGSFVYCGTSNGLRIYAWPDLRAAADGSAIEPRLYFNPPADVLETNPMHGYVHATVDDNANNRVLFAASDGRIRAARLDTGEVSLLFELPDRAVIYEMHLVGESSLVCRVAPGIKDRKKRRDSDLKGRLQVWNLRAIDEMNVKGSATPAETAARDRLSSTS